MRVFIIPLRNDAHGLGVQVLDLHPNNSQKNNNLEGDGQTQYVGAGVDVPGTTHFNGDAYVSGSKATTPIPAIAVDDTTGGGNDVQVAASAALGLTAYLRERVQPGGTLNANAGPLAVADAANLALAILAALGAKGALTLAGINVILSTPASGGTVGTDLDGAAALSKSFGAVTDILRILCGEVYRSPRFTIITNVAGQFRSLAERNVLVAAQDVAANGGTTFVSTGTFLTTTENGYTGIATTAASEDVVGSIFGGDINALLQPIAALNPDYAYTAAAVTNFRKRAWYASAAGMAVIPATGLAPVLCVYNELGANWA